MPITLLEKSKLRRTSLLANLAERKDVKAERSIEIILPRLAARAAQQMPKSSLTERETFIAA